VRQEKIPQAQGLGLGPQFEQQRRIIRYGALGGFFVEALLVRVDVLIHEVAENLLPALHLVAVFEMHIESPVMLSPRGERGWTRPSGSVLQRGNLACRAMINQLAHRVFPPSEIPR
jgi:hypothetical protein